MSAVLLNSPHLRNDGHASGPLPRCLAEGRWPGIGLSIKEQDISSLTTWRLHSAEHIVVVHLKGAIHHLETELEGTAALLHPPMAGEVWVVPAHARYASLARGGAVRYAELYLDPAAHPETDRQRAAPLIRPRAGHYDAHFHHTVQRLSSLVHHASDLAQLEAASLSRALYFHFFREYSLRPPLARRRNPRQLPAAEKKRLEAYIDGNLAGSILLADLARLVGRSVHQLLAVFRDAFGTTPAQYVIERRLRRARALLLSSASDITSIALESGFSSHAHFTGAFKNHVGVTPSEYRRGSGIRRT